MRADWVVFGLRNLVGGLIIGVAVGWVGALVLSRVRLAAASLYPVLALGLAGLAYGVGRGGGVLRVPRRLRRAGWWSATGRPRSVGRCWASCRRSRRPPRSACSSSSACWCSRAGSTSRPSARSASPSCWCWWPGRSAVLLSIVWFGYGRRELALVSWAGLRGAVPIVLATFPVTAGYPDGQLIFDVVFFVVIVSVLVQGFTLEPLVRRLGLAAEPPSHRDGGRGAAPRRARCARPSRSRSGPRHGSSAGGCGRCRCRTRPGSPSSCEAARSWWRPGRPPSRPATASWCSRRPARACSRRCRTGWPTRGSVRAG